MRGTAADLVRRKVAVIASLGGINSVMAASVGFLNLRYA
jgi:hypothetical protein